MSVDKKLVLKISKLSRLSIEKKSLDSFVESFSEILNYIDLLNSASSNEPDIKMDSNIDYAQRDDTTISKLSIDEVLKNAPKKNGNFFSVKKIIDEE